jgi:hypothetical protein
MPGNPERRRFGRYVIVLPLLHRPSGIAPSGVEVGWSRNLSEGGACVELNERLRLQAALSVRLQTDRGAIDAEALVIWASDAALAGGGVRHGLAFAQISPDHRQTLRDLLLAEGEMRQAGVRLPLELPVTCRPKGHALPPIRGRTGNMSRGGLLLNLPQVVPPETVLELTLHTPQGPVTAEGAIVWVEPEEQWIPGKPIRHGLRFTVLGWSTSLSLGLFLLEAP